LKINNYALISTPTPLGIDISCSIARVLAVGSCISTSLLCLLISNCSLASLLTKVDLLTVIFSIFVGRGIGQTTTAPESFAIATIFCTASSRSL
jgi:hypothetical protein